MPVEVCLEMYAERSLVLPFFTGHVSRGLLLHVLREVDPSLAYDLHREDEPKPYSVTPLRFRSAGRVEAGYVVDAGSPVRVWFRFLRDELAEKFMKYFYNRQSVLIYDVFFNVASLTLKSESYGDLWNGVKEPVETFRLYFLTPTYLSTLGTDYHYLFPDHVRIFSGLMRLWNMFSDYKRFSKDEFMEYKQWLLENVGVSQHKLKTCLAIMGRKKATGFMGWTTYEIGDQKSPWNKTTQTLAKFAQYSNIGGNRTGGFGVTKMGT
ncbi:CRISPR-associated endoribonuclease Cas6 [Candidatus Bathyarchaeota archaeon]|nr:CRISPR-associated endoribonuclease Cas6 [Candidatus Bathyarchaeota archaeon]